MMDDPNITIEEYIKLQAEKSQRRGQMFNWETATYSKIYCDNLYFFTDFEVDFPAIVYNDALALNENVGEIYGRGVHRVHVFDFGGSTAKMAEGLSVRMLMEHRDVQGQSVFTSRGWRWLFEIRGLLRGISSERHFLGSAPSYTAIRDPMLRLCHRLIACSIAGRSQAPEKVTSTDLFYLRGMDVRSVNIPYLLARYLRRFASGKKRGAMISRGQFLKICDELDNTSAWVALRPERQPDAVAEAPKDVAGGVWGVFLCKDEGAPAMLQHPVYQDSATSSSLD
ncbi:hypothetical protein Tco_0127398 [Tanacetum coccineum]